MPARLAPGDLAPDKHPIDSEGDALMRSQSSDAKNSCQHTGAVSPAQVWASPAQIARIFGFTPRWYRKSVRQRLRDAEVPTVQVSDGPRGLRWHLPTVTAVLTSVGGAK